jgi:hypothetical protein
MKIKLFVLAVASTFALGSQAATFQNSSFNWNNASSSKAGKPVGIVKGVLEVAGISRNADNKNTIDPAFAKLHVLVLRSVSMQPIHLHLHRLIW